MHNITILPITAAEKQPSRFVRPQDNETFFILSTGKYVVEIKYASSNFYAPEFYYVKVKDRQGNILWDGQESVFLDSLFSTEFISDRFDKIILNRVNDTGNSHSQQLILIDLKNGTETALTAEGYFTGFGHFRSFNAIYYSPPGGIRCIDLEDGKEFMLNQIIESCFSSAAIETWSVCPVQDCIVVLTKGKENNLLLFNVSSHEIVGQGTVPWEEAERVNRTFRLLEAPNEMEITVAYSHKAPNGYFAHTKSEYYKAVF